MIFSVSCEKDHGVNVVSVEAVKDSFVTKYTVGDNINIDGALIQITYSNGNVETVPVTMDMIDMSSFSTAFPAKTKTLKIFYQNYICTVYYQVQDKQVEITVKNAYLENIPTSFLKGEDLTFSNGILENAFLCLELSNDNVQKYPIKSIWINSFSTNKAGNCSCTVDYESDYGPVSVVWNYTVQDLASVSQIIFQSSVSVYQSQSENYLRNALTGKSFLVKYSDDTEEIIEFDSSFKISGFSSNKIGKNTCILTFTDSKGRNIRYTLEFTVKQNYDVYSVTFDPNYDGGTIITVNTFDGKITPPAMERKGYETLGWYAWDGVTLSSEPFNFDSIIEENITLRPRWRRLTYTITIYSFGTLLREPEEYNVESEKPLDPPSPIDGYTFSHFADENGNVFNSIQKGTSGNLVLNCVWIANGYDIEYDLNDLNSNFKASNPNPDKYTAEEVLFLMPAIRNGYNFEGWYYNNQPITSTQGLSKNIKITARWSIAEYTLTLVNPLTEKTIQTLKYKITDSNTKIADFQSDEYFFYGWYKDSEFLDELYFDASHQYYWPSGSFGDFYIYAKIEVKYTVILDTRNNGANTVIYFKDTDEFISLTIPVKFGSDFICWLGQGVFNGTNYYPVDNQISVDTSVLKTIMAENNTKTANFLASYDYHQWKIIYNLYSDYQGQEIVAEDTFFTNVQKELLVPEREGYVFLGWYTNSNFTGSLYEYVVPFTFDSDLTLFAKWKANVYSISVDYFFDNIEKPYIPQTYTADDQITLPFLSYPNYLFVGWFLDGDYSIPQPSIIDKGTTGNLTLFAKWEAISLEMNLLNMTGAIYQGNLSYSLEQDVVVLADASRQGYEFLGWFLDRNLSNKVESFRPSDYPEGRIFTAYAKWSTVQYTITYVLSDNATFPATNDNQTTITIEDHLTLSNPSRIGFTFDGWFYSSKFDGNAIEVLSYTTNDITLYAKWKERVYSISYENCDFEGVDISKLPTSFKATTSGTSIASITRKHYTFDGWYVGETKVTKVGLPTDATLCDDLVLTAKWTAKNYTLTFSANGKSGKVIYTADDFVDGIYTLPSLDSLIPETLDAVVLKGREFVGWYKGSDSSTFYTSIDIADLANITFNALTTYITYNVVYYLPDGATNPESNPLTFTMQSTTFSVSSPTLENKVFSAWFTDNEFTTLAGKVSNGKTNVTTTDSDIHLYAKFVDIHDITYELPTGVSLSSSAPTNYNETKAVALSTPTSSFNFGGWWWKENKKIVTNTSDFGDYGNVTLLALVYDKTASAKIVFDLDETNKTASIIGYTGASTLKIPTEVSGYMVTNIVDMAFYANTTITTVTIPNNVSVGYRAFANCSKLATLTIEGGSISSEAFINCPLLKTVTISPDAVVSNGVFANCTALTTLNVGNNKAVVSYFSKTANANCTVCGGYYVPNTLNTVKLIGSPESSNGILSTCSLVTKFYIDGTSFVELSPIDLNVIKNNDTVVYVKASLLAEYQSKYSDINFLTY